MKSAWENKRLYVAAIDASKAFDKVNRDTLWCKLIDMNIKPSIISGLKNYYDCSTMLVSNNGEYSSIFRTTTGVKQGGVISPKLFAIYMDDLINDVEKLEHGISFGTIKVDIVIYADDILLINQSRGGLRDQLNCVTNYGAKKEIKFNPNKTVYMVFNKNVRMGAAERWKDSWQGTLELAGNPITQVSCMKYLGVEINDKDNNIDHLRVRK